MSNVDTLSFDISFSQLYFFIKQELQSVHIHSPLLLSDIL